MKAMRITAATSLAAISLGLATADPAFAQTADKVAQDLPVVDASSIDAVFKGIPDDEPGCSVGVIRRGEVVYKNGYGLANVEHGVPNTGDTVFRIASTSKQFTAMSTILLAAEGKISLDDDVRQYIPELPDYGDVITIRQLINHTNGIRDFLTLFFMKGYKDQDYFMEDEFLEMLARQERLEFRPGEKMSYTNSGYVLQSLIIERVTGKTLAEYAKENIFDPLKMKSTHFHDDVGRLVMGRAYGYAPGKDGFRVKGTPQELTGDGGVFTTIDDLARFDRDFYEGKVWRPEIKKEMITPGVLNDGGPAEYFPNVYYAGGLIVGKQRGVPYIRHAGQFAGFLTDYIRYPEQGLTVAALCNGGESRGAPGYTRAISDLYLKDIYSEPEKRDDGDADARAGKKRIPRSVLEAFPGVYYNPELDVEYEIVRNGKGFDFLIGKRKTKVSFKELGLPLFQLEDGVLGNEYIKIHLLKDEDDQITAFDFDFVIVNGMTFTRKN